MKELILLLFIVLPLGVWGRSLLTILFRDGTVVKYRVHQYWTDFIEKDGYESFCNLPADKYQMSQQGIASSEYIVICDASCSSYHNGYYKDYCNLNATQPFNSNYHWMSPEHEEVQKAL